MNRKDEKVNQIITAAKAEFLEKGFSSASMQNISDKAQVSKRTLYKYFPTKDDLYDELINEILDQISDIYSFKYEKDISIKEQITTIASKKIKLTTSDSFLEVSRIVMGELLRNKRPSEEQLERINENEEVFLNWIVEAKKDGKITAKNPNLEIANNFHSILKGQIYWPVLMGFVDLSTIDLQAVEDSVVEFFLNTYCC